MWTDCLSGNSEFRIFLIPVNEILKFAECTAWAQLFKASLVKEDEDLLSPLVPIKSSALIQ